ncbi:zinc-binding dehydrogenase [Streptomyces sp. NBC_00075]|uniref:zinc-binding dehydrogenase n=1 Tax=Streptomyces sp. NBC_00075 TaxID=2975641 RepID=UPI0032471468
MTGGRGADVVFDSVAGRRLSALADTLVPGGDLIVYGWMDESPVPLRRKPPLTIHNYALSATMSDPGARRQMEHFTSTGLRTSVLEPAVGWFFEKRDKTADAHQYRESNQQFSRVVVTDER